MTSSQYELLNGRELLGGGIQCFILMELFFSGNIFSPHSSRTLSRSRALFAATRTLFVIFLPEIFHDHFHGDF